VVRGLWSLFLACCEPGTARAPAGARASDKVRHGQERWRPRRLNLDISHSDGAVINPQLVLSQPQFTNDQFQLTLSGPAGSNAVIYANTDPGAGTWAPLATNPMHIGSAIFTDTEATNYPVRCYRALLMP